MGKDERERGRGSLNMGRGHETGSDDRHYAGEYSVFSRKEKHHPKVVEEGEEEGGWSSYNMGRGWRNGSDPGHHSVG